MQINSSQALTQAFAQFAGSLPMFIAIVLAWLSTNARTADLRHSLEQKIDDKFTILNNKIDALDRRLSGNIDDTRELLREEFHRVEEVMDARLKHLEEHQ